ncbi:hypothetical protein C8R42DRAFT_593310 [Lentinula raphanica]|nr:hypothetical protein C8R42DRAFT_593310 [Lentinula raphanica]
MQHHSHRTSSSSKQTQSSDASDSDSEAGFANTEEEPSQVEDDHDFNLTEYQAQYIVEFIESLYSKCYLCPCNNYRHPPGHLRHTLDVWKEHQPDQFRENLRVTPETFDELVNDIQDDTVFSNNSPNEQAPVADQLAIALYRFGHSGNGANMQQVTNWAGKKDAKQWVEEHSCQAWRDGIYLVDGTLVAMAERPFWFGESYFDQKCNYSLNI